MNGYLTYEAWYLHRCGEHRREHVHEMLRKFDRDRFRSWAQRP